MSNYKNVELALPKSLRILPFVTPPNSGEEQPPSDSLDEGGNLSCGSHVKGSNSGHLDRGRFAKAQIRTGSTTRTGEK